MNTRLAFGSDFITVDILNGFQMLSMPSDLEEQQYVFNLLKICLDKGGLADSG